MDPGGKKRDMLYLVAIMVLMISLPLAIGAYERNRVPASIAGADRTISLTGSARLGWIVGDIKAWDMIGLAAKDTTKPEPPIIRVRRNEHIVLKIRSSDVTHGFSLPAFGIYFSKGIPPGKTIYAAFTADRVGRFPFRCTTFCGDIHPHMTGTLVVRP